MEISESQKSDYFRTSFMAIDGLWFMKMEEKYNFEAALDIDTEVWKIVPKIQARFLKGISHKNTGLNALAEAFSKKLELEGFEFSANSQMPGNIGFSITKCPWIEKIMKSGRAHLAEKIANRICFTEYSGWAAEFGESITFSRAGCLGADCGGCELAFREMQG
jgi:hypothetical protein